MLIPWSACVSCTQNDRASSGGTNFTRFGGRSRSGAIALYLFVVSHESVRDPDQCLSGAMLAIVLLWLGGFLMCYGVTAWRRAAFSLLFLLLMVPLPPTLLERSILLLQQGSTEIAYLLFRVVGVPVLRQGFLLTVPGVTIEVAKECSGIRSSVALVITCLLAAHLFLRTRCKLSVFVLLAFPLAIIKNAIRITTLTLLAVYVDPSFLTGSLHHEGGFVFFLLALAILAPVLMALAKVREESSVSGCRLRRANGKRVITGIMKNCSLKTLEILQRFLRGASQRSKSGVRAY